MKVSSEERREEAAPNLNFGKWCLRDRSWMEDDERSRATIEGGTIEAKSRPYAYGHRLGVGKYRGRADKGPQQSALSKLAPDAQSVPNSEGQISAVSTLIDAKAMLQNVAT